MIKFLLFLICIKLGYSYPEGAPHSECTSMMPQHDVTPKECSSKYVIQSDKSKYNANEIIRSNNKYKVSFILVFLII
jgi:hypothetical protein